MMNRWKTKTRQRRIVRECAIVTIRVRRLVMLELWRTRTERGVALRRALRIWRHGVGGAARLVLSTMKARRVRRRDALIHLDRLVVRNLQDIGISRRVLSMEIVRITIANDVCSYSPQHFGGGINTSSNLV